LSGSHFTALTSLDSSRSGRPSVAHQPELHDLDPADGRIGHRAEKFVDRHVVPGLFQNFPPGGIARMFARHQLALRQHPRLLAPHPHDGEARLGVAA
jgi:hypothetical protein